MALLALGLAASAVGQGGFKPYPGATKYTPPDTEQNRQFKDAVRPGTTITAYLTKDSFEKVVDFYKGMGKEYAGAKASGVKLPNGQEVKKKFVILDGAPDILRSKSWLSVQHPFFTAVSHEGGAPEFKDVRDLTEIVLTEKVQVAKETSGKVTKDK